MNVEVRVGAVKEEIHKIILIILQRGESERHSSAAFTVLAEMNKSSFHLDSSIRSLKKYVCICT